MKNLLRYLAFVLMVGGAFAQSNLPACPTFGYFDNCFGTVTIYGTKYIGEWKNDKFNGSGTYTWANGSKYVGEFKNGVIHGLGTEYASNGNITKKGIWENDVYLGSALASQANSSNTEKQSNLTACPFYGLAFPQFSRHLIMSKLNWRESHEEN